VFILGIHGLIDRLSIFTGTLFAAKYFREDLQAHSMEEHLKAVKLSLPEISGEGDYIIEAETLAGSLETLFRIAQWKGADFPTIIYHHGAAEIPFDFGFNKIFPLKKMDIAANFILIRAPYHDTNKNYSRGRATADGYLAMIATSVLLIDQIVAYLKEVSQRQVIISGSSLGGFISNIHHIYFNSADSYVPLLAGLNMYDAIFESIYSKSVAEMDAEQKKKFENILDFSEDFKTRNSDNVYPLLATDDQLVRYDVQKKSYGNCSISSFARGHLTGSLSAGKLREHILSTLWKEEVEKEDCGEDS